jgi:hypothetical protein
VQARRTDHDAIDNRYAGLPSGDLCGHMLGEKLSATAAMTCGG